MATEQPDLRYVVAAGDREAIRSITRSSGFFSPQEIEVAISVFDDTLSDPNSGYHYVVAELHGEIKGYACFGPIEMTESSFDLYWLAVDDSARSHGIGKLLIAAVESVVPAYGCEQLFVETAGRPQYLPTQAFYEARGYQRAATLVDFYAPGDDKVIYVKRVTGAKQ